MDFWHGTHIGLDALRSDISSRQAAKLPNTSQRGTDMDAKIVDPEYIGNPVPVGTLVEYQGSIGYARGETFAVIELPDGYAERAGYGGMAPRPGSLTLAWPNDLAHVVLWNVRPKSVRVLNEGDNK